MISEIKPVSDLRRKLLDEARILLQEEGFHDLSMRKIAAAAGVSATSIYLYFEGKDQLLHALIEEGFEILISRMQAVLKQAGDERDRLLSVMSEYFQFAFDEPAYYELMFAIRPVQMERYPAEKFRRARYGIELTAEILKNGRERGVFKVDDASTTSWFIWSSLHGAVSLVRARRLDIRIPVHHFLFTAAANIFLMLDSVVPESSVFNEPFSGILSNS